jgi:hypothetical protein
MLENFCTVTPPGKIDFFAKINLTQVDAGRALLISYSGIVAHACLLPEAVLDESESGSLQLTAASGSSTPVGAGIFSRTHNGTLITESGIPSALPTTHVRIYVDMANGHDSGLAIASTSSQAVPVTLKAFLPDGFSSIGSQSTPLSVSANGHAAAFVRQWISGLPSDFRGVLDLSSPASFAALTLRALTNSRNDFLLTAFPVADFNRSAPAPVIFPHLADGSGYITEFILLSAGEPAVTTLKYFGSDGTPLATAR